MIDERELREMLERRAATISATPTDAPKAIRRARRRLALNAVVGTFVGLGLLAGAFAGLRAIQAAPTPADPPTPTPTPADVGALAYTLDGDIYVAEWDGSNSVKIADGRPPDEWEDDFLVEEHCGPGEYSAHGPIWSPDGRYLGYRHMDCDAPQFEWDVVISDKEGNVVTSFPSDGWGISWSPDSTRVAVWDHWGGEPWMIGVYGLNGEPDAAHPPLRDPGGRIGPGLVAGRPIAPSWQLRDSPRRKHTTTTSMGRPRRRGMGALARRIACRLHHPQLARRCRCRWFQRSGGVRGFGLVLHMVANR